MKEGGMKSDKVIGVILIVFSAAMYVQADRLPQGTFGTGGADFFPKIIFILLGLVSLVQIASAVVRDRASKKEAGTAQKPPSGRTRLGDTVRYHQTVIVSFGIFLFYVILMYYFGYLVSTLVFMILLMWILGPKDKKSVGIIAGTTLLVTFGLYYFFLKFLKIFLPTGMWL